jgi:beta-glucosidase-like glycosyl hydrolase
MLRCACPVARSEHVANKKPFVPPLEVEGHASSRSPPALLFDEALHGLLREGATAFPQAIGAAATFDTALMATPKHSGPDVGAGGRDRIPTEASLHGLTERHSPSFLSANHDADAGSVMTATTAWTAIQPHRVAYC